MRDTTEVNFESKAIKEVDLNRGAHGGAATETRNPKPVGKEAKHADTTAEGYDLDPLGPTNTGTGR